MRREPCAHCHVPTPIAELHRGYCARSECVEEAPPLEPIERAVAEVVAVAACVAGGVRAKPRPCPYPEGVPRAGGWALTPCPSCVERAGKRLLREQRAERYGGARRWENGFCEQDAVDLDRYYRMDLVPRWERSTFGQMCQHLASSTRVNPLDLKEFHRRTTPQWPKDDEPPSGYYEIEVDGRLVQVTVLQPQRAPESWASEVVRARGSSRGSEGGPSYGEDDLVLHFDRRYRMNRVVAALGRLQRRYRDVLEARYTPGQEQSATSLGSLASVGLLTEAAKRARKARAEAGVSETLHDTLRYLSTASQSTTIPGAERRKAKERLVEIETEAGKMLDEAEAAYAKAAMAFADAA